MSRIPSLPTRRAVSSFVRKNILLHGLLCILSMTCTPVAEAASEEGLLWFDMNRPTEQAFQAVTILSSAHADGLVPQNYNAAELHRSVTTVPADQQLPFEQVDHLEQALTASMERFLTDLHFGQIDPRGIGENFNAPMSKGFNPAEVLRQAVRDNRLTTVAQEAAPSLPLYSDLRLALAHYRQLAENPDIALLWSTLLPPLPDRKLEVSQAYEGLPLVMQRLQALGDLDAHVQATTSYTDNIADGVKRFQTRHGLNPDGIIGRRTFDRLGVSPTARVRQIELTMERLRWTPLRQAPRMIAVNIPENLLEAYEVHDNDIEVKTRMRVISGTAQNTPTPIFDGIIRSIEFSPYWNVPLSIARKEIVPKILRDPSAFDRLGYEFVYAGGSVGNILSFDALEDVRRGALRLRQRPGPANPMGDIKFVIPDRNSIYLHHTASPQLFTKDRRDLSHGCIRVQDPVALAQFVLNYDPAWSEERIHAAMGQSRPTIMRLPEPMPVIIAYQTVRVKNDGLVYFFADVYGQDKLLDKALRRNPDVVN